MSLDQACTSINEADLTPAAARALKDANIPDGHDGAVVIVRTLKQSNILRPTGLAGVLYIGDPHGSSRKPGTRNDQDFTSVVLDKIEQAVDIANQRKALVVILGDLFDRENDADGQVGRSFLTRLIRILRKANEKPVVLAGNHDKGGAEVTDDTTLAALAAAGVIHLVQETELFLDARLENGRRVILGGTPHGMEIPADTAPYLEAAGIKSDGELICGWITHEDLAFAGAYPGALEMFEIRGCDIVVNGHMHLTKEPIKVGQTLWCNPGNITRQSKDCADHVPSVWSMTDRPELDQIPLQYRKDVFDAVINHVSMVKTGATPMASSSFVDMLKTASQGDVKTEDGSLLLADIQEVSADLNLSADAKAMLISVHEEAMSAPSM